jgi:hypothetical protein
MTIVVAGRKFGVAPRRYTWLEAIHKKNIEGKRLASHSVFNEIVYNITGNRKGPLQNEFINAEPLYSGTIGILGASGKPLGNYLETQCMCMGNMKAVVVNLVEFASLVDILLMCDQGFSAPHRNPIFPDGVPFLQLSNRKTGKPILTDEDMGEADEVLLTLAQIGRFFIINERKGGRDGGIFEELPVNPKIPAITTHRSDLTKVITYAESMARLIWHPASHFGKTYTSFSDSQVIGLLARGCPNAFIVDRLRERVHLRNRPTDSFGVVEEIVGL